LGQIVTEFFQGAKSNPALFPVDLKAFTHFGDSFPTFAFLMTADRKLHVWSVTGKSCLKVIDLVDQADSVPTLLPPVPRSFLQLYSEAYESRERDRHGRPLTTIQYKLAVYLPLKDQSVFQIYAFRIDTLHNITLVKEVSAPVLREEMVDFGLTLKNNLSRDAIDSDNFLWGVWEGLGKTTVGCVPIDTDKSKKSPRWSFATMSGKFQEDTSALEHALASPATDPQHAVLSYLFCPGRFSRRVILKALLAYQVTAPLNCSVAELRSVIADTVLQDLQRASTSEIVAPEEFQRTLRSAWLKFLSHCVQNWQIANSALGLHISQNVHLVMLVKADSLSLLRRCDAAEVLHHFQDAELDPSSFPLLPRASLSNYPALQESDTRQALLDFIALVGAITSAMSAGEFATVSNQLRLEFGRPRAMGETEIAVNFRDKHLGQLDSDQGFLRHTAGILRQREDYLREIVDAVLAVAASEVGGATGGTGEYFSSEILQCLAVNLGQEIVSARVNLIKNLILVVLVFKAYLGEVAGARLSSLLDVLRTGLAAVYLQSQILTSPLGHPFYERLSSFPIAVIPPKNGHNMNIYSIYFLSERTPTTLTSFQRMPTVLVQSMLAGFGFFSLNKTRKEAGLARCAHLLDKHFQPLVARSFIQLLPFKAPALFHVLGKSFALLGEIQKAEDCFSRAAVHGLPFPPFSSSSFLFLL